MIDQLLHGLRNADAAAASQTFADDVTLNVAVHDEPFNGKATATAILAAVLDGVFTNIDITETIGSSNRTFVMFDLDVVNHPRRAQGLMTVTSNAENKIDNIDVYLRPLAALQEVAAEMGRRLGGPRPEGN